MLQVQLQAMPLAGHVSAVSESFQVRRKRGGGGVGALGLSAEIHRGECRHSLRELRTSGWDQADSLQDQRFGIRAGKAKQSARMRIGLAPALQESIGGDLSQGDMLRHSET